MSARTPQVNDEAIKIIADLAAKAYADELDRAKATDGRSATLIAATGAGLFFLLGGLAKLPDFNAFGQPYLLGTYLVIVCLALIPLLGAEWFFLRSIWVRTYKRIKLYDWITYSHLGADPKDLLPQLASTYDELVRLNTPVTDEKLRLQESGLALLIAGLVILGFGTCIVMIVLLGPFG